MRSHIDISLSTLNTATDIATLSRMTGKDFSGPPPEIRAPTPVRVPEINGTNTQEVEKEPSPPVKKVSTAALGEEILGDVEEMTKEDIDRTIFA